jgi:hypothetical protein
VADTTLGAMYFMSLNAFDNLRMNLFLFLFHSLEN